MPVFRELTPVRRPDRKGCKNYNSYHKTLREDFNNRCGYCDDSDKLRIRSFTIDHFVPQNPRDFTHDIPANYYCNLVYACNYCNSSKANKWPTNNAEIHNNGREGFIDPTEESYTELFKRSATGKIIPSEDSHLANYILAELKLWLPIHEKMWKLERLNSLEEKIKTKLELVKDQELKEKHYQVMLELDAIIKNIFVENE
ncbi:MAG: HNH endonuclease [Desulfobacteraceae bacterium]|nr:HNH endonuclease [Desulfobacteraceae bacterium]